MISYSCRNFTFTRNKKSIRKIPIKKDINITIIFRCEKKTTSTTNKKPAKERKYKTHIRGFLDETTILYF